MVYDTYIENGFKFVGNILKSESSKKKHKTKMNWVEDFDPKGKMGVYILANGPLSHKNILKIGESQNLFHRFQCYESHIGPTNVFVRDSMEFDKPIKVLFLECPSFEVGFGGVEVPCGINYRILEKKLIEQYELQNQSLPIWNKGRS
jgi:hypothetical protein